MSQLNNPDTGYIAKLYYNSDLGKLIPPIQYVYYTLSSDGSGFTATVTIQDYNGLSNYFVLTSLVNNSDNNSNLYTPSKLVTAVGQIFIHSKTPTSFKFTVNTTTGDIVSVVYCFTIIYYSS
jgi:hypothetical protein